jgi:peptidoglycan/LPS O-acetylase OafA/YrhL
VLGAGPAEVTAVERAVRLTWVVALRGFAALAVYAFHLWLGLGGDEFTFGFHDGFTYGLRSLFRAGYQGVDLFFVLSGFVIAWPYVSARKQRLTGAEVADFYQRRYFRIAPLFYVTIVVVVVLIQIGWLKGSVTWKIVVGHLLFMENFIPYWVGSLRGVYWTLPTEMHFYLVLPLVLRFIDVDRPWRFAAFWIVACIGYRAGSLWSTFNGGLWLIWTAAYLPGRMDQFACGMAAACALATTRGRSNPSGLVKVIVAACLAVAGLVWIGRHEGDLGAWFTVGPSAAALLIAMFVLALGRYAHARHRDGAAPMSIVTKAAIRLGEASFGIYLWHTIFIDLAITICERQSLDIHARMWVLLATVPITVGVSLLTWRFIEAPFVEFARSPRWRASLRALFPDRAPR